jgi:uncharacterized protein
MNVQQIINKYYPQNDELRYIYMAHAQSVAELVLKIAQKHEELPINKSFLYEAAMLHDLGIFKTDAPKIKCFGNFPYICHGYLGADILREEGYPKHALVCERHTGTGLSLAMIQNQQLPLPRRDLLPISLEEQMICYADKFFSKTKLDQMKTPEKIIKSIAKYGEEGVERFLDWQKRFSFD